MELRATEQLIKDRIPANLFRGFEGVGGHMTITSERLVFQPHRFNIQSRPLEVELSEIAEVSKRNTALIIPNGMKLTLHTGQVHKFVVYKRSQLIQLIQQAIQTYSQVV